MEGLKEPTRFVFLDIVPQGVVIGFKHINCSYVSPNCTDFVLPLAASPRNDRRLADRRLLLGEPLKIIDELLRSSAYNLQPDKSVFVLGTICDPFVSYPNDLSVPLRTIEMLAKLRPNLLSVQTRSAFIMLATPFLTALGSKACVTVPLENANDSLNRLFCSSLPQPSERMETLEALREIEISTGIQATPMFHPRQNLRDVVRFGRKISSLADYITVIPRKISDALVNTTSIQSSIMEHPKACLTLREHLRHACPAKLLGPISARRRSDVDSKAAA